MAGDPSTTDDAPVTATRSLGARRPAGVVKGRSPTGAGPLGHSDPQPVDPAGSLPAACYTIP